MSEDSNPDRAIRATQLSDPEWFAANRDAVIDAAASGRIIDDREQGDLGQMTMDEYRAARRKKTGPRKFRSNG